MWGQPNTPAIHNRGAVAHPEATTHDEDVEHIIFIGKFAESATAPRLMPSRYISLSPCSRLHYVCRQHEVTNTATAHAVVHALSPTFGRIAIRPHIFLATNCLLDAVAVFLRIHAHILAERKMEITSVVEPHLLTHL